MGHYRTGGSGREPLNLAHRSTAEPCERSAYDVSTIRLGDDRQAQPEQARHRVVRDKAVGRARLVHDRAARRPHRRWHGMPSSL